MLQLSLFELALATCFSSEAMARLFKQQLIDDSHKREEFNLDRKVFVTQCRKVLADALDKDYPRRFRLNDLEQMFQTLWPEFMFRSEKIPQLSHCFERLMTQTGAVIHYQPDKVADYSRFMARFDPAVVVGWHLAQREYNNEQLASKVKNLQPLFAPMAGGAPVAENHTHLGGMHYDGLVLVAGLMNQPMTNVEQATQKRLKPLFRLTQLLLLYSFEIDNQPQSCQLLTVKIKQMLGVHWAFEPPLALDLAYIAKTNSNLGQSKLLWLRKQLAIAMTKGEYSQAWVWLQTWLWHCYIKVKHYYIRMSIVYLITELMAVRRLLIMDGRGLSRFVQYYEGALRKQAAHPMVNVYDSCKKLFSASEDVAEIKATHGMFEPDNVGFLMKLIAKVGNSPQPQVLVPFDPQNIEYYQQQMERWHFCIHLVRRAKYQHRPDEVWKEVEKVEQKLQQQDGWYNASLWPQSFRLDKSEINPKQQGPMGKRWLRGLDVAGDENLVKTEVFAPALRWLRTMGDSLHFSIHAGEDYAHPLSGMRHIDETVQFCRFKSGDRLGHGLALGIIAQDWFERHGEVILPLEEHLDNLVWMWGTIQSYKNQLNPAEDMVQRLESRIDELVPKVSWATIAGVSFAQLTPKVLFDAWRLRRNCFYQWQQYQLSGYMDHKTKIGLPDINKLLDPNALASKLYLSRWNVLTQAIGSKKQTNTKVLVRQGLTDWPLSNHLDLIKDDDSEQEICFYLCLQDHLLEKYRRLDVSIEVNLSSNVYIANIESFAEHPVFRWFPFDLEQHNRFGLRRKVNKVCINTDDAGIMPTTLRTEFKLLTEAAKQHEQSQVKIDHWIEQLRQFGIDEFNRTHRKVVDSAEKPQF